MVNCGNGRNDWATVAVNGKPAKGSLFWKRPAVRLTDGREQRCQIGRVIQVEPVCAKIALLR